MDQTLEQTHDYDLIVIGAGPVGENVADYATRGGARVAIVEAELVGGECSYWACMPSKALLRSGHAVDAARRVAGAAQAVTGKIDVEQVLARRTRFTSDWDDQGQVEWLDSAGITLLRGRGRVVGKGVVEVDGRRLRSRAVALATGSVPVLPEVDGLAAARPWGTREAASADHVPRRLVILGGGVAGSEYAVAYSSLGAAVTLVSRGPLLPREEPWVGEVLARSLAGRGVDVRLGASPDRLDRRGGVVTVVLDDGTEIDADEILVATGRRPRSDDLGLQVVGLDGELVVDDTMLVEGTDWLYAVGDVNGRALLTHQGKYQAQAAGAAIAARLTGSALDSGAWGRHVATADHHAVPRVVFTDPEVAAVGFTVAQAQEEGRRIRTASYDLGAVAGASLHADGYEGRAMLVIDDDRGVIVGATFVGQDVAELVHAATIAIVGEVPLARLWHAVPAYPTMSEVWLRLLEENARAGASASD